jgi:hypothetical protein
MTLPRAREIIHRQLQLGGGYNPNLVRLLLGEARRGLRQAAVGGLIRGLVLEVRFGLEAGTDFSRVGG